MPSLTFAVSSKGKKKKKKDPSSLKLCSCQCLKSPEGFYFLAPCDLAQPWGIYLRSIP